ncbi:unnamed protein product, partial [Ectocarpus sp. 6 AP-2014]
MVSWLIWRCCSDRLFFAPAGTRERARNATSGRVASHVLLTVLSTEPLDLVFGVARRQGAPPKMPCARGGVGASGVVVFLVVEHRGVPRVPGRRHAHLSVGYVLP